MDSKRLETMLWRSEGDTLDFKRDQYQFEGADDDAKGELLKDILAFANAWRTEPAYIIVGVKEKPGHRGQVHGVAKHLSEAALQQFVSSKTNRPVRMSYTAIPLDDKQVGVLKINPGQKRPFYLNRDYGKLKSRTVYLRRGSSTAIADPDEVASMGNAELQRENPVVSFELADPSGVRLGTNVELTSDQLVCVPTSKGTTNDDPIVKMAVAMQRRRQPDPIELKKYRMDTALLSEVRFFLRNESGVLIDNAKARLSFAANQRLRIHSRATLPKKPRTLFSGLSLPIPNNLDVKVTDIPTGWEVIAYFGKVQPQDSVYTEHALYLGATEPMDLTVAARVFADNISEPLEVPITICITSREVPTREDALIAPLDSDD